MSEGMRAVCVSRRRTVLLVRAVGAAGRPPPCIWPKSVERARNLCAPAASAAPAQRQTEDTKQAALSSGYSLQMFFDSVIRPDRLLYLYVE